MRYVFTPERIERLKVLWADRSYTRASIAAELGCKVNTLKARVSDMGLPSRAEESPWSPEMVDRLKTLWSDGLSGPQIGRELGFTRSAVNRKLHRLGLATPPGVKVRRERPARAVKPTVIRAEPKPPTAAPNNRANAAKARKARATALKIAGNGAVFAEHQAGKPKTHWNASKFEPLPGCEPVPFMEMHSHQCRWPVGGDGALMLVCGGQRFGESYYCAPHVEAAHGEGTASERNADKDLERRAAA